MSGIVDTYITYRIVTTLVKKWEDQDAYQYGIIDNKGKVLRKYKELKDRKEKDSYTVLIRFIFNMKRLMEKIPGGKSKISSYAVAALVFLREEAEDDEQLKKLLGGDYDTKKL
jgi:ADP-glucose pyrophosphorylase|tara:strand:- start:160 stop:498 length:339 start_codon:yes stop_codon:yes gene_type:complete